MWSFDSVSKKKQRITVTFPYDSNVVEHRMKVLSV